MPQPNTHLKERKCVPCEGGTKKLGPSEIDRLRGQLEGWEVRDDKLCKTWTLKSFVAAMGFVNRMADVAELEGHHPDIAVHYNVVEVTLWTHAIGGLSDNDFILAAKIDGVVSDSR